MTPNRLNELNMRSVGGVIVRLVSLKNLRVKKMNSVIGSLRLFECLNQWTTVQIKLPHMVMPINSWIII